MWVGGATRWASSIIYVYIIYDEKREKIKEKERERKERGRRKEGWRDEGRKKKRIERKQRQIL